MQSGDISHHLGNCRTVAELRATVETQCAEFGTVLNVTLICGNDQPERKLCVIDLVPGSTDIQYCADRIGGRVFGFSSVIVDLLPHPEFICPRGSTGELPGCSCIPKIA
jgi:hypothetical protein